MATFVSIMYIVQGQKSAESLLLFIFVQECQIRKAYFDNSTLQLLASEALQFLKLRPIFVDSLLPAQHYK